MRFTALWVLVLVVLAGCSGTPGAGATQNPCGLADVKASAPGDGNAQAQAQSLQTGQTVSNQPTMTDPAKWSPGTTWGGGAGAVDAENNWIEERSQSGAPSVAQGLLFPATQQQQQDASSCAAGGASPAVLSLQGVIHDTQKRLDVAIATSNNQMADSLRADLKGYLEQLQVASADIAKTVNIHYDFNGSYITQGVSSSSTASGKPGSASTSEDGTEAALTPEEIAREAGAVAPVTSESLPEPPAGVAVPE